jgi:hypothetical protein
MLSGQFYVLDAGMWRLIAAEGEISNIFHVDNQDQVTSKPIECIR